MCEEQTDLPLVTVVCLCYRQAAFLPDALRSVAAQTYPRIELILADDHSQDGSEAIMTAYQAQHRNVQVILSPQRIGNCALFNQALAHAQGKYIIDLAADDVMLPEKIATQVARMEQVGTQYGMCYSDAYWTDEKLRITGTQYQRNRYGKLLETLPEGNIYEKIVARSFICPPTVMYRTAVLKAIGGYDEQLAYEDFDSWVRIARHYQVAACPEPLILKRVVAHSHSTYFYQKKQQKYAASTLAICQKIAAMNQTASEQAALATRLRFELRQSFFTENYDLVPAFFELLQNTGQQVDILSTALNLLSKWHLPIYPLYALYRWGLTWWQKRWN